MGTSSPSITYENVFGMFADYGKTMKTQRQHMIEEVSVFFAPARYRVVKIVRSCSEVVLQTVKNYKAHYSLFWCKPLL
jgi:hypothetical protein